MHNAFFALHKLLSNHLTSIVGSSLNVDGLLDDGGRVGKKSLSGSVL